MKARYGLAMGFTVALIGCGVSNTSTSDNSAPGTSGTTADAGSNLSQAELAAMTLVRLKVPNMT